jgi:hypothetical protein
MSGQTRLQEDVGEMAHPDDSVLLAYIRQQSLGANWSHIDQHISGCPHCHQRSIDLIATSKLLTESMQHFQQAHKYPSLAGDVIELLQNPVAARRVRRKRQRARLHEDLALGNALLVKTFQTGIYRVLSVLPDNALLVQSLQSSMHRVLNVLPGAARRSSHTRMSAMPKLLLAAVVIFTLSMTASAFNLFHVSNHSIPTPFQRSSIIPSHDVTVPVNLSTATVSSSKKTSGASHPTLQLCQAHAAAGKSPLHISICGSHFPPGAKVRLVARTSSGQLSARHLLVIDAHGNFQDSWIVLTCKEYPATIFVQDLTHVLAVLQTNQSGRCSGPTPIQWPHGRYN